MGMPKGLGKATNYYNKQEAWLDWLHLSKQAHAANQTLLVKKYQPADSAGWMTIDKSSAALREELSKAGIKTYRRDEEVTEKIHVPFLNCRHKSLVDGTCSHPGKSTPECHQFICPIKIQPRLN